MLFAASLPWLRGFRGSQSPSKRVAGPCFWLVGAQGSQRFFLPRAVVEAIQRHGRTRVELKFTKRSESHAWYRGAPGVRACSLGSCGRSKRLCDGLVACTSVQGMKTGHAQICGRGRRNVARLEKATQKPACNGCKRAILATKANCAPRLIGTGLPDDSNGTQLEGHGIRSLGRRTRQNNNVEEGQRGNWALREFSFFWPTRLPLCPANPLG